jgi:hypothetical protein
MLGAEDAAPCRHAGVPPQAVVAAVVELIRSLGADDDNLRRYGLTAEEYRASLPAAIETMRGSMSASNGPRRIFLERIFLAMKDAGTLSEVEIPTPGADTVYKLTVPGIGHVAVIQKGCPDGRHSSVSWSVPEWANESYLWWVCDSTNAEPGEHIKGGVNRLRKRFFTDAPDTIDGVIFQSSLCGTPGRICPKSSTSMSVAGSLIPAPCIYIMPERQRQATEWNWNGTQQRLFPAVLLSAFGVPMGSIPSYTGYVGFRDGGGNAQTTITSRYGIGRTTIFRS